MAWFYYGRYAKNSKRHAEALCAKLRKRGMKTQLRDVGGSHPYCVYTDKSVMSPAGREWHEMFLPKGVKPQKPRLTR